MPNVYTATISLSTLNHRFSRVRELMKNLLLVVVVIIDWLITLTAVRPRQIEREIAVLSSLSSHLHFSEHHVSASPAIHHRSAPRMTQDDILQSTKSVIQGLDALKNEHGKMLDSIVNSTQKLSPADTNKLEEKVGLLRKSMDMIELGIGEAQVMMQLGNHLQNLEAEKHKLRTQVKRLCQENAWLRDELAATQKKLHECEQTNASYSVEIEHLKFLKEVKQYDVDSGQRTMSGSHLDHQPNPAPDLVNDLFPSDENDNGQDIYGDQQDIGHQHDHSRKFGSYADLMMSASQSATGSFISTTGYEIPARLKTLHNLVIQYASQGRYEVAVPLCRQALEDLEKTSGHQRKHVSPFVLTSFRRV